MSAQQRVGAVADLPPGKVVGVGRYAVGNADGRYFAVTRRCRHLGADLAGGSIDENGCLVCPWHRSAYDVGTGRMVRGPQGVFAKVPGLDFGYRMLTRVLPLGRAPVTERDGELYRQHLMRRAPALGCAPQTATVAAAHADRIRVAIQNRTICMQAIERVSVASEGKYSAIGADLARRWPWLPLTLRGPRVPVR